MSGFEFLERYAPLVDDLPAFQAACRRALPRVVWANPLRADPAETAARIRARCPEAVPVAWRPHTFRLPPETQVGAWLEHLLGHVYVQEEAALWAGDLLEAKPGERVLDLCAAPGGKAAQAAVAMDDRGTLVANERKRGRLPSLRRTFDRLGVTCAAVTQHDALRFVAEPGSFDAVMADVPCSCEGTSRKMTHGREDPGGRYRASIIQVQKAILRKAVKLCRPGGRVVYATCTYAPEENEAVLSAVSPDDTHIEAVTPPVGLRTAPGLGEWEGRAFRPDAVHAHRIWPHHNDTGGFFVARLRRL